MKRLTLFAAVAITLFAAVSLGTLKAAPLDGQDTPAQDAPAPTLSAMQDGEKAVIRYQSQGCFHHREYTFTFTSATPMTVNIQQHADNADPEFRDKATKRTATLTLTPEEVAALDETFKFYRSRPRGGCTTSDTIGITWYQGGNKQKQEAFTDASCNFSGDHGVTLSTLIFRILPFD